MEKKSRELKACEPDEDLEKFELDVDDTQVQVVDGVIVGSDDEEVKMLFFYKKPGMQSCRAIIEFRASRTRFQEIAREVNDMAMALRRNESNPMFV